MTASKKSMRKNEKKLVSFESRIPTTKKVAEVQEYSKKVEKEIEMLNIDYEKHFFIN